jgi:hypothetical protein
MIASDWMEVRRDGGGDKMTHRNKQDTEHLGRDTTDRCLSQSIIRI